MGIWHRRETELFSERSSQLVRGFAAQNYTFAMHDHDFFEINIISEGNGIHYLASQTIPAKAGDVFVIPPGVPHAYEKNGDSFTVLHLIMKNTFFSRYKTELESLAGYKLLFEIEPYLRANAGKFFLKLNFEELTEFCESMNLIFTLEEQATPTADTAKNIRALDCICSLTRIMEERTRFPEKSSGDDFSELTASLEYIHSSFSEKITIDTLASMCNMSRSTYIRKFHRLFSKAPMEYLQEHRCKAAVKMIRAGISKTETACSCGFYDSSHMEKAMKKVFSSQGDPL